MKKTLATTLIATALAPFPAQAGFFLGAETGSFSHTITLDTALGSSTGSDSGGTFNLVVGWKGEKKRTYAAWHIPDANDGYSIAWLTINRDHLFRGPSDTIRPFIGAGFGIYGYTVEDFFSDGNDYHLSAFTMNPEIGVIANFDPVSVDVSYRYGIGIISSDNASFFNGRLDSARSFNLGLSYHF